MCIYTLIFTICRYIGRDIYVRVLNMSNIYYITYIYTTVFLLTNSLSIYIHIYIYTYLHTLHPLWLEIYIYLQLMYTLNIILLLCCILLYYYKSITGLTLFYVNKYIVCIYKYFCGYFCFITCFLAAETVWSVYLSMKGDRNLVSVI